MAISPRVDATADVHPPFAATMLKDELVKLGILLSVAEDESRRLFVGRMAEGSMRHGDGDVGRLTFQMLRRAHTAHGTVECLAAVATGDEQRQPQVLADGFKTAHAEILHAGDMTLQWYVRQLQLLCRFRAQKLAYREMLSQFLTVVDNNLHQYSI